jgi:hypothetical protein
MSDAETMLLDDLASEQAHVQRMHEAVRTHVWGRRWVLYRTSDVSGVSGTGVVAQGIEFPDGRVAYRWHTNKPGMNGTTQFADCIEHVQQIHGHGGDSRIVFVDVMDDGDDDGDPE